MRRMFASVEKTMMGRSGKPVIDARERLHRAHERLFDAHEDEVRPHLEAERERLDSVARRSPGPGSPASGESSPSPLSFRGPDQPQSVAVPVPFVVPPPSRTPGTAGGLCFVWRGWAAGWAARRMCVWSSQPRLAGREDVLVAEGRLAGDRVGVALLARPRCGTGPCRLPSHR